MRIHRSALRLHSDHEEVQINLTPLIDVVFVILIMFIIVAPMLELDRVQLASAAEKTDPVMTAAPENAPITIHVHADDSIWFNAKRVSEKELVLLLKTAKVQYPARIPQLFHDKQARFGTYQNVKNAIECAGFEQLDVILQPN